MRKPKLRSVALVGAIAAVAASAWAANETTYHSTYVPAYPAYAEPVRVSDPIPVSETLSPNETVVIQQGGSSYADREAYVSPPIVVEQRRLTTDERIQLEVMERLAANARLSGKIGVESKGAVVRLSGWTRTVGQARNAEREARGVMGVKYVQNEIRPRVGGSV